ncbi:unnamed protein product [Rotaria sp. Silwood1]|nr:unnamed protein product [Rotaria sp. Silwood1]CAF3375718.1 unnamed protein product [Rotaria sp. Silwood1]CAF4895932.1 unnamed protein product [Rotaria sp. Silwood1]
MITLILTILDRLILIAGKHFNEGTIRWEPINPFINFSTVSITTTQRYSWAYLTISCATDVPISTTGRSNANTNLTCTADCSTDRGYSIKPVNILTDCISASSSLGMMTSERSVNITLSTNAHVYLSYMRSAWVGLNYPPQSGLQWSMTTFIDLRFRDDCFINTPPVASVVSPQYAIVNTSTQIRIPASDPNAADDVLCRWSIYTPGVNRRRRSIVDKYGHTEVLIGIPKSFSIYAMTICDPNDVDIAEFVFTSGIYAMVVGNLMKSASNSSLSYVNFTWAPQTNQIGLQELCMIVFAE